MCFLYGNVFPIWSSSIALALHLCKEILSGPPLHPGLKALNLVASFLLAPSGNRHEVHRCKKSHGQVYKQARHEGQAWRVLPAVLHLQQIKDYSLACSYLLPVTLIICAQTCPSAYSLLQFKAPLSNSFWSEVAKFK